MGIKRRAMFNPKFRNSRTGRWNIGRRMLGIPTEQELEAKRLAEELAVQAAAAERAKKVRLAAEAETARLKAEQEAKVKLAADKEIERRTAEEAKAKLSRPIPKLKTRTKTKTTRNRKTRGKKE